MHFHRALNAFIVSERNVCVAATDVRKHNTVFVGQGFKQIICAIGVSGQVRKIFHQCVVRPVYLPTFVTKHHIAVAAQTGVSRPFVTWEDDKSPILVELGGELVEFIPKRRGDLKVVALVAHRIQKGGVACKFDQFASGVGANGFF